MMTLKTPVRKIGPKEARRITEMVLRWCRKEFGDNRRKAYLLKWYIQRNENPKECGEYVADENEIYIYWNNLDNIEEIIRTCIHEWTHYKQPILTRYFKFKGPYSKNPFEIKATRAEEKYTPICWNALKKKINKQ